MSTAQTRAIARRFYEEALNGKNLDIIDEIFATNYQAHPPGMPEPLTREAFKQFNRMFLTGFPDLHITIEDEIVEGDQAVLRLTVRGTQQGALWASRQPASTWCGPGCQLPALLTARLWNSGVSKIS